MTQSHHLQAKMTRLIEQLCEGLHEREQIMAICLLGAIVGHNTFLYGPPGTAKSLISRRLASAFEQPKYFEYLMNRFSTPEEVFGPVSIKALKEDKYIRKINGYLPTANFAFLDEIWKASPAILNNLLTIVNEHIFKNGDERVDVPLKSLIAASNEVPMENQGLEALYDRFIIRLLVPPIEQNEYFKHLLDSKPVKETAEINPEDKINYQQLDEWRTQLHNVKISDDVFLIIDTIRKQFVKKSEELGIYVSDRRWQRAATLLKASAYCNGRTETNHSDAILLKYCLWTTPENREQVESIVLNAIKECGFNTGISLADLDLEKEKLDKEIQQELYHSDDIYDTVQLNQKEYFYVKMKFEYNHHYYRSNDLEYEFYIPFDQLKSKKSFHPVDEQGNAITDVCCDFDGQGSCKLFICHHNRKDRIDNNYKELSFTPKVLYKKGSKKNDVNKRLIFALSKSIKEIRSQLFTVLNKVKKKQKEYQVVLNSPFVHQSDINIAISGISEQINQIDLRIKDCERLESLCR